MSVGPGTPAHRGGSVWRWPQTRGSGQPCVIARLRVPLGVASPLSRLTSMANLIDIDEVARILRKQPMMALVNPDENLTVGIVVRPDVHAELCTNAGMKPPTAVLTNDQLTRGERKARAHARQRQENANRKAERRRRFLEHERNRVRKQRTPVYAGRPNITLGSPPPGSLYGLRVND